MNNDQLNKANDLSKRIKELESFMFWCSGRRKGCREYPAAILAVKRKWYGAIDSAEYAMSERLQAKVAEAIEEELALLKEELEAL